MTNDIKKILEKYNLLEDNIFEDNLDNVNTDEITDILIIFDNATNEQKIKCLHCANELNTIKNRDTLYLTYTLINNETYLTTLNVVNNC